MYVICALMLMNNCGIINTHIYRYVTSAQICEKCKEYKCYIMLHEDQSSYIIPVTEPLMARLRVKVILFS